MSLRSKLMPVLLVVFAASALMGQAYPDRVYFKFNEGSGLNINNFAYDPNGPVAQPTWQIGGGGMWVAPNDPLNPGSATNAVLGNGAMDFAGLDRISTNYPTDLSTDFTIEMWVRTNYTGNGIGRLWGDYSVATFRCYLGFYNTGANYLGGNLPVMNASPANVQDMGWHHLAVTWNSQTLEYTSYVDGVIDQQLTGTPGAGGGIGSNFQLGGVAGTSPIFNGAVDEFRFWSTVRTPAEIAAEATNPQELLPPVILARFNATAVAGSAPLVVTFNDFSATPAAGGITGWAWDVDGDSVTDYTTQSPCHTYTASGTYDVTLTVTDGAGGTHSLTKTAYINVGAVDFALSTCGLGDVSITSPPPPAGWAEGYTLVSADVSHTKGIGPFFGVFADGLTWAGLATPAAPGNPLHFSNIGNPAIFPDAAVSFPAGTFPTGVGFGFDGVMVFLDGGGSLLGYTGVARVIF